MRWLVLLFACTAMCAADAPNAIEAWHAWLSQAPTQRQEAPAQQAARAKAEGQRWLVAWCTMLDAKVGAPRLKMLEVLLDHPAPADAAAYMRLEQAKCWIAMERNADAVDVADRTRRSSGSARLRYEACRVLADALDAAGRTAEASEVRREAVDLAQRELYADTGVAVDTLRIDALDDRDPSALYADAERERAAGRHADAEVKYRAIIANAPQHPLAAASVVGLGWCRVHQGDSAAGITAWQSLIVETSRKSRDFPAFIAAEPTGPFRGQAYLALIDQAIAGPADPVIAAAWLERLDLTLADHPDDPSWNGIARQARLYRIILHMVFDRQEEAQKLARDLAGDPGGLDAPAQGGDGVQFIPASGAMRLVERQTSDEPLTPRGALVGGKPPINLRLVLADAWDIMEQRERARALWDIVLQDGSGAKPDQLAYARMRRAESERADMRLDAFRSAFEQILAEQPGNPWASYQRLCLAVDDLGRRNDAEAGLAGLRSVMNRHPTSPQARTAAWYIGLLHFFHGRWRDADRAWAELDARWPDHPWRQVIEETYRPMLREAERTGVRPANLPMPLFPDPQ